MSSAVDAIRKRCGLGALAERCVPGTRADVHELIRTLTLTTAELVMHLVMSSPFVRICSSFCTCLRSEACAVRCTFTADCTHTCTRIGSRTQRRAQDAEGDVHV
eukprot:6177682-Pleurochrysis_carterae.AAC.1